MSKSGIHTHHGDHGHEHGHSSEKNRYVLLFLIAIVTFLVQAAVGKWAGSIAVVSDGFHTFIHSVGFLLSIRAAHIVAKICQRGASEKQVNRKRAEYGLANAFILLLGIAVICSEAYKKFVHPEEIIGSIMVLGACLGLFGNLISFIILHRSSATDEIHKWNLRHVLLDLGESAAVLISVPIIFFFHFYIIDSILSFAIAGIMLYTTLKLLITHTFKNL